MVKSPGVTSVQYDVLKVSKQKLGNVASVGAEPWKGHDEALKPCWKKPSLKVGEQPKGFIIFSLLGGPEYHVLQVANAVLIARHLGATLVLPDIIGNKPGDKRKFGEIYDVHKFVTSLDGLIKIANYQPPEVSSEKLTLARVPYGVSEDYVTAKVEPLFKRKGNLKLVTYFPTSTMTKIEGLKYMNSISCLAVFEALRLQAGLQEVVDSMLESLRTLSRKSDGQFIAVDLRVEMLGTKGCQETGANGRKSCFSALEIGQFLKKIGFQRDTTIYLTQNGWHNSLDALTDIYPNTYTKESLIPEEKVARLLTWESSEFTKVIDFYICSQSDVFVPALSSLFYENVVGERIAAGKTQILFPAETSSAAAVDYLSPYMSQKSHLAYSCFC